MTSNRLFIYDQKTKLAACIAKGYSNGWASAGGTEHINNFFDLVIEFTGSLSNKSPTRLELKTEDNLPKDCAVFYQADKSAP